MPRCRLSPEGKRRLHPDRKRENREGEYLGPHQVYIAGGPDRGKYRTDPTSVRVRWDGTKTVTTYHRDYIEIIDDITHPREES